MPSARPPHHAPPRSPETTISTTGTLTRSDRAILVLYTAAIVVAAALLFVVQPMVGKMVLPLGGGSPQVWITALVFFQASLLAGYAYAHLTVRWLGPRWHIALHAVVLLLPFLTLPIALPAMPAPEDGSPSLWILTLLTVGVGAPFFVIASASPLLQTWLASTRHASASDPYFLYAGSNAGSLVGLLAYPFVVEPLLPLSRQSAGWAAGYALFVALAAACGAIAFRAARRDRTPAPSSAAPPPPSPERATRAPAVAAPVLADRAFWLACAFVPSALLTGVTHFLTSRIAPVPLLWVFPLAIYLLTYIAAFSRRRLLSTERVSRLVAIFGVFFALALLARIGEPTWLVVLLHFGVLGVAALLCHQRLADRRPAASHLTEFYLLISLGGVLGGAFSGLVAPVLFDDIAEYPIAFALAALLRLPMRRPGTGDAEVGARPGGARARLLDVLLPAAVAGWVLLGTLLLAPMEGVPDGIVVGALALVPTIVVFTFSPRPLRYALALAALFTFALTGRMYRGDVLHQERTFFGVYRVTSDPAGQFHMLYHGATAHGIQSLDPEQAGEPLAYYHRSGPAGGIVEALARRPDKQELALVGAGTGALAALAGPHQRVTLFEIDPAVVEIAKDPRYFTFLRDARAKHEVVVGDGRIRMAESDRRFDLIVLDAFTGGSIPIHLMTREAVQLYLDRLRPGGALLFHVSNRHLALAPVLAVHARDLGLVAYESIHATVDMERGILGSHWVILVREPADLAGIPDTGWGQLVAQPDDPVWTDDFSNLLSVQRLF